MSNVLATGHGGGHDMHHRTLHARGVELLGHYLGAADGKIHFADDLSERSHDEDIPQLQDIAAAIACLYRKASRNLCPDCGSYEECRCNERADWIATGGN